MRNGPLKTGLKTGAFAVALANFGGFIGLIIFGFILWVGIGILVHIGHDLTTGSNINPHGANVDYSISITERPSHTSRNPSYTMSGYFINESDDMVITKYVVEGTLYGCPAFESPINECDEIRTQVKPYRVNLNPGMSDTFEADIGFFNIKSYSDIRLIADMRQVIVE